MTLAKLLADALGTTNPRSFAQIMPADDWAELLSERERTAAGSGFDDEVVPISPGGRWSGMDYWAPRLRPVFRRDIALGFGYGVTSSTGAVNVCVAGDRKFSDCQARGAKGRIILNGRNDVVDNAERVDSLLLFARIGDRPGARGHSLLPAGQEDLKNARFPPCYRTGSMRGCRLEARGFTGNVVGVNSFVGVPGTGAETASRAFQVTRTVLPVMALGVLDFELHVVHRFAAERRLHGQRVAGLPHARDILACVFADLLIADYLVTSVARGTRVAPRHSAAAVRYLVPLMLEEAMGDFTQLSTGARRDHLAAAQRVPAGDPVRLMIIGFAKEFERLTKACLAPQPAERAPAAGARIFTPAEHYAVSPAVAACVGTWLYSSRNTGTTWLHIALIRLAARLWGTAAADLPEQEMEVLSAELVRRSEDDLS